MTRPKQSRRRFLGSVAAAGVLGGATAIATTQAQAQTFRLGGVTSGWQGRAPSSIEGETNPTLQLQVGQDYAIFWENVDGQPHNVAILDAEGNELVGTEIISGQGQTQTLEFTATEEMAEYYCAVHPNSMRGDVELVEGGGQTTTGNRTQTTTQANQTTTQANQTETPEQTETTEGAEETTTTAQPDVVDAYLSADAWNEQQQRGRRLVAVPTGIPVAQEEISCTAGESEQYDRYTAVVVSTEPIRSERAQQMLDLYAIEVDLLARTSIGKGVYETRYTVDDCFRAPYLRAGLASVSKSELDEYLADSRLDGELFDRLVAQLPDGS